eukprot:scaffold3719_cov247-Pinguiococcus_pyrenoidosus.AAC.15
MPQVSQKRFTAVCSLSRLPSQEQAKQARTDVEGVWRQAARLRLRVRVDRPELHAFDVGLHHAIDRVASAAAHAQDLDHAGGRGALGDDHLVRARLIHVHLRERTESKRSSTRAVGTSPRAALRSGEA